MKNVLILGGTKFVGRRLVELLLPKTGYDLTLFNRNRTNPGLFDIPVIEGDRETDDINKIFNRDWDFIIDISGYFPNTLEKLVNGVKGRVGRYIYISTVSVYPFEHSINKAVTEYEVTENCTEEEKTDTTMSTYGKRKAECERVLLREEGLDKIILRPSVIYGKYDYTDRFYYWLFRVKTQKKFILPDDGKNKQNLTYVDDFADIIIKSLEVGNHNTTYNTTTHSPMPLKDLIEIMTIIFRDSYPDFVDIPSHYLEKAGLEEWRSIPFWLTEDMFYDNSKIKKDFEFKFRDLFSTVEETVNSVDNWKVPSYGISIEKELEIINNF